jgi:hypothetical protein
MFGLTSVIRLRRNKIIVFAIAASISSIATAYMLYLSILVNEFL